MQKRGVVACIYNYQGESHDLNLVKQYRSIMLAVPARICAAHYCYNDPMLRPQVSGFRLLFLVSANRLRFRAHFGPISDVNFELQTCGIRTESSPFQANNQDQSGNSSSFSWSIANHLEWLEELQQLEELKQDKDKDATAADAVVVPRRFDVLFGKSKASRNHTGTMRAHCLVGMHFQDYENANRREKTKVADRVISIISESNGRFLKWEKGAWVKASNEIARGKVSHFFRNLRLARKKIATSETAEVHKVRS